MSGQLEILIPTSSVDFYNSVVSEGGNLKYFNPSDHLLFRIIIPDTGQPYSATAIALDNAVKTGTFTQKTLENFLNDSANDSYSVEFSDSSGVFYFPSPYGGINFFQNYGNLKILGTDIIFIPYLINFELPSFVQYSGSGYAEGFTNKYGPRGESISFKELAINLNAASISGLHYSITNFFDVDVTFYKAIDTSLKSLITAKTDINKYYPALMNFLAEIDYNNQFNNSPSTTLNFNITPNLNINGNSITTGSSYVTNASLSSGSILLDIFPHELVMNINSVDFEPGPVAETLTHSPVFESTSKISITPSYTTETYFTVCLKPGFTTYPLSLINQIFSTNPIDQVNAVRSLLSDPSVLINGNIEYAFEQDLNSDNILDGENFAFGIKDIQYVNGTIKITPDKPTNFVMNTTFHDFHYGTAMPDLTYGLGGNDNISTLADDDSVHGGTGNDIIDGGSGYDRAYFQGPKSQYTITTAHGITTVVDSQKNRDDIDTLVNVEELVFTDQAEVTVAPSTTLSFRADIASNAGQSYRLYQAALDRTPDLQGLSSWINYMDNGGQLNSMSQMFIESPEFKSKYGPLDNYNFVNQLYLNVLDRSGEATGVTAWVGALDSGSWTRAQVLVGFSESAENQANVIGQIKNGVPFVAWWLT